MSRLAATEPSARRSASANHPPPSPPATASHFLSMDEQGERDGLPVHDLLDRTWHYHCVGSPKFSPPPASCTSDYHLADPAAASNHVTLCPSPPDYVHAIQPEGGYVSLASLLCDAHGPPSSRYESDAAADRSDAEFMQHRSPFDVFHFVRKLHSYRSAAFRGSSAPCRDSVTRRATAAGRIGAVTA